MTLHIVEPTKKTLHGHYSRDLVPILNITSGDSVRYRTLDAGWGLIENPNPFDKPPKFADRDRERDPGHALCGPIAIQEAKAGMTLEVRFETIRVGTWGWSAGGGYPSDVNTRLNLADSPEWILRWELDSVQKTARNQSGQVIAIRPFMGNIGMPHDEAGRHSTFPPRFCGGNMDCKELVEGSGIFLPIAVDGGLFSLGDGHAVQGDGEVSGPALECPMEEVEVEFHLHPEMHLSYPRANTAEGWITFGFHEDLHEASMIALDGMLELMVQECRLERKEALALSSLIVHLRVTQIVNGVRGVHAILPHEVLKGIARIR
jgi:acetamidase/formamidase